MAPTSPRARTASVSASGTGSGTGISAMSSSSSSSKLPPTGPKAMRIMAPFNPPSGPSALQKPGQAGQADRVSIAFPAKPIPSGPSSMYARPVSLESRLASPAQANGSKSGRSSNGNTTNEQNGLTRDAGNNHAESSRQASSRAPPPHLAGGKPSGPRAHTNGSASASREQNSGSVYRRQREPSTSPTRRRTSKSPTQPKRTPHSQEADAEDQGFRASFLPTTEAPRAKISFAVPMANGLPRPKPPHLDLERLTSSEKPPPAPPPISEDRPPTPPPPDDLLPPPPPSPPARSPSPLPPPPTSGPASASRSPYPAPPPHSSSSRAASLTSGSRPASPREPPAPPPPRPPPNESMNGSLAPPPFHFRQLPLRRPASDEDDEDGSSRGLPDEPVSAPPSPPREVPNSPTPPPYVAPPYVPPPCVYHRPGLGNYTSHKGKDKEWIKRFDGMDQDVPVKVTDPRASISADQLSKGRGSMKQRTGFYELEYEWDEFSTTPKPPPPPTAVLITGLSPLTTTDQISKYLRPYGRIKDIDAKMDTKSGMQLGICWVKFDGPPHGRPGTAHDVAVQVVRVCDGQRISLTGDERIKVVLDGRGLRTQKAVKEEMDKRYAPKPKPQPPKALPTPTPTPARVPTGPASTPSSTGAHTPRTEPSSIGTPLSKSLPAVSRSIGGSFPSSRTYRPSPALLNPSSLRNSTLDRSLPSRPLPSLPPRPSALPQRPDTAVQHLASSFTAAPFSHHVHREDRASDRDRHRSDYSDRYRPGRRRSRSRSVSSYSSYSSYSSDSDDARPVYRARTRSPIGNRRRPGQRQPAAPSKEDEKAAEKVKEALSQNGHAHVFIDVKSLPASETNKHHLQDHFKAFRPAQILYNHIGWYILFAEDGAAYRAQRVLDKTAVQGHRIGLVVKTPPSAIAKPVENDAVPSAVHDAKAEKGTWRFLTITKKNRPAPAPQKPSPKVRSGRRAASSSAESSDDEAAPAVVRPTRKRLPSFSSASSLSDEEAQSIPSKSTAPTDAMDLDDEPLTPLPPPHESTPIIVDQREETPADKDIAKGKKRPAKGKLGKAVKKARLASPVIDVLVAAQPEVAEIKLDEVPDLAKTDAKVKPAPKAKKPKAPRSEVDKFLATSGVEDDEDAYWLGQALAAAKDGVEPSFSDDEDAELDDKHPLYHQSGAWRAEGWKKIPQIQKSTYLPQRNRAAVSVEEASGVTTGRTARLAGRDQHRQTAAVAATATVESDLFAFNQLRIRKKQLRFARSAIEGYGLYAMETINVGEMVCEYVGELCRAAVAEVREQRYLKQGIGSSYLFRIDNDTVCDATFKGSVSRLINHSCDPSANAKIIKVNGQSKIVIYAERTLHPGEEILYDYKFPLESDPALRVPCLCGASTCRGWLN